MHNHLPFLQGGGELGERIRNIDWAATKLNAPETWPDNLKSAIALALNSGFPIAIYWGEDFTLLYNDAWSSIPGQKHPWALGKPGAQVWPEIWEGLKQEFETVLYHGQTYRRPDAPLYMHRYGYTEECYFDYSLSPIVAADGSIGGVFNAVVETTYRVINERRNEIRNQFLSKAHSSKTLVEAYDNVKKLLTSAFLDISFFALYNIGADNVLDKVVVSDGLNDEQLQSLSLLITNFDFTESSHITGLDAALPDPICRHWPEPVSECMAIPINNGEAGVKGYLVLGTSARKRIDGDYLQFLFATAANTGTVLNNAYTLELSIAYKTGLKLNTELYEEQQAMNEELAASNEELFATNEQLATTNEQLSEMQSQLNQTLDSLGNSEQRFRNLIREATVGIILLIGPQLVVEVVNDAYGKLVGRTTAQLLNKPLFDVIPENEKDFRNFIEPVLKTGEPTYLYEQPYHSHENGIPVEGYLNIIYQPYRESEGRVTGVMALCQDVSEQVRARKQVEATERRFQFMLNAIPQQVWTALPDGKLNYANQVVANDFGYPSNEVAALGWQSFVHPDDLPSCTLEWEKALRSGKEYLTEFRLRFPNGEYIWHLARAVPLIEEGKITLWLGTNTNIEAQKQNEQRKDEFLSIASHELKTPLTGIKAFTQLMRRSTDLKRTATYLEKTSENIFRLEKLINDLLDVTKINAGKLTYDLQPFDFSQMLKDSIESVQLTSATHQIILEDSDQISITGDRMRLEQVLNNFLSNAIKYSPEGNRVIVKSRVDKGLIVSVQDFGVGIEEQHIQRLFDRYYRIDNTAMRFEGLGLGLFISSEILKRHMGTFWIESDPGKGSTFYFRLPIPEKEISKPIKTDLKSYLDSHISIIQNEDDRWMEVDWTGFQTVDSVKAGGNKMIDMLKVNEYHKVLNDNTHVLGSWSEAADWTGQEWFPMMEQAGLRYLAWVYSPSVFSRLSAEKAVDVKIGNTIVQFFTDMASAKDWLRGLDD